MKNSHNIAFITKNKLESYIKNNKEKFEEDKKSGIYKVNCGNCEKVYIGKTCRSFKTRISEHLNSLKKKLQTDSKHKFNFNIDILHTANRGQKLHSISTNRRI